MSLKVIVRGAGTKGRLGSDKNALRGGLLAPRMRTGMAQLGEKMAARHLQGRRAKGIRCAECIIGRAVRFGFL